MVAVLAVLLVGLAEGVLRLLGQPVLYTGPVNVDVVPGGRLFTAHPTLGYTHLPGAYRVTIRDALAFQVTHGADGLRITHPPAGPPARPQVWITGGSFTHGWTVDDAEAYPWLLQAQMPSYEVRNYGVSGYGTVHAYLQVREALERGERPAAVVVTYASYHDERNTFLRLRRKAVALWNSLGDLKQPYARVSASGELVIHEADVVYDEIPLTRRSVFKHALERTYNRLEQWYYDSHAVSEALLLALRKLCEDHGVPLYVAGIYSDALTAETLAFCRAHGIPTVDLSVDLSLAANNQLPYDSHPGPRAHVQYAGKLYDFLGAQLAGAGASPVEGP
jgi:hypothetical protein